MGAVNDTLLAGGGGTDTLNIGANFTSTGNAQIATIENIVLTAAGTTLNLANQTEAFTITGSSGIDNITGGSGADSISAGAGNDTIAGVQADVLLDGGADTDTLNIGASFTSTSDAQIANIENVTLTAASTLVLTNQAEAFTITGSAGIDSITGGTGADSISAGAGNDTIIVVAQNDALLDGGTNTDTLSVGVNTFTSSDDAQIANIENVTLTVAASTLDLSNQSEAFTITGSTGIDTITSGIGADTIDGGTGADTITAGAGNDVIVGAADDALLDGGADTDTLRVDVSTFTSTSDAQIANIENVTLTVAATLNLSNQSEGFTITGSTGIDKIIGGSGNDTISAGAGADRLVGGLGNDSLTGGADADQFRLQSNGGVDTIVDYVDGTDKIAFYDNGATGSGSVNFTNTVGSTAGVALNAGDFITRTGIANIANADVSRVIVISAAQTNSQITTTTIGGTAKSNDYVIVFNSTTGRGEIWFDTDWRDTANRVQIATLDNVTTLAGVTAITAADIVVYSTVVDPIVLDLGTAGLAFNPIANGVNFDLNADGVVDQVAWTTGEDGILAYDVDGSGTIDSGSELFTPWFAGGLYTSGVEALASLDSNADGVINASDTHFYDLQVWIDADVDGISDGGELSSLFAQGIESLSLNTTASNAEIDGQTILSEGLFTNTDGSSGTLVEVGFEVTLGSDSAETVADSDNNIQTGSAGTDTFAWVLADQGEIGAPAVDTIVDFDVNPAANGGDILDLRDLLVGEAGADNLANFLHFEKSGDDTIVHISTTGGFSADEHAVGAPSGVVTGAEDQRIVLTGVDMIGAYTTDQQVIQDLLTKGKLNTDSM